MKITALKTIVVDCFRTNWVFVKVETDEGLHGIGEGTLEYKEAFVGLHLHEHPVRAEAVDDDCLQRSDLHLQRGRMRMLRK